MARAKYCRPLPFATSACPAPWRQTARQVDSLRGQVVACCDVLMSAGRQGDDAYGAGGVRRLNDAPLSDVDGDVRDRARRRVRREEDEIAGLQCPPSNSSPILGLQGSRARQKDAECVIDRVGKTRAIEAEGRRSRPQVAHAQELPG